MREEMEAYKNIRYAKLNFTVHFIEDTDLVREKASAIRGGIGEMLLRAHCIGNRDCESCGFEEECLVQRILYSKFEHVPQFMQTGNSAGYVICCTDKRRLFCAGDLLEFSVTLFGKTIVYFCEILNAVYALGVSGLGKNRSRFEIHSVRNLYGEEILDGCSVRMEKYRWQTLGEYVSWKKRRFPEGRKPQTMKFYSPAALKYRGEFVRELSADALAEALWRRLYILSQFEGLSLPEHCPSGEDFPDILRQQMFPVEIPRRSLRRGQFMKLRGMIGEARLDAIPEFWLDLLLAGEVAHIGKNTSFGFGGYKMK